MLNWWKIELLTNSGTRVDWVDYVKIKKYKNNPNWMHFECLSIKNNL